MCVCSRGVAHHIHMYVHVYMQSWGHTSHTYVCTCVYAVMRSHITCVCTCVYAVVRSHIIYVCTYGHVYQGMQNVLYQPCLFTVDRFATFVRFALLTGVCAILYWRDLLL